MNDYEIALEFDKVLNEVYNYAFASETKERINNIKRFNNVKDLNLELDKVDEALRIINKYSYIELNDLNIKETLAKIRLEGFLSLSNFMELNKLIYLTNKVLSFYREIKALNIKFENLEPYFLNVSPLRQLEVDLNLVFDDDFNIKDNASVTLLDIRKKIKMNESSIKNRMIDLLNKHAKLLNDNIIVYRDSSMCLPVKVENKNAIKGVYHGQSASNTTVYIEPIEILELNNKILEYKNLEKAEIERIMMNLSTKVWPYASSLDTNYHAIIDIDFVFAKARYANFIEASKPKINERGVIELVNAYHPLIERQKCVPIDLKLGIDYDCIVITGPNTGGKTVSLKTVGLLSLMIKYGLLVPVNENSNLALFNEIYADIDNVQSIEKSLSTFSANIKHVAKIVDSIRHNSLVLFDELGSGTDPKEGSNLAISIIDYLLNMKAKIICTTHYSDLKVYAYNNERIINASVLFDEISLMPTYKIQIGISGASNAITIARRLGLKEEIIENATKILNQDEKNVASLMERLEVLNNDLMKQKEDYAQKEQDYKEKLNELNERENQLIKKYLNFEKNAKDKADKIIKEAKEEANQLLEEIKELAKKEDIKTNELADIKHKINQNSSIDADLLDFDFKVGDVVLIKSFDQVGSIEKIKKDDYVVKIGNMAISVKKEDLAPHFAEEKTTKKKNILPKEFKNNRGIDEIHTPKLELDLRGYRYEEVKSALELFIDQAYLANMHTVYVIHGYGTGAVRKACHEYFKKSPYVKETRFGGAGEGLNGVTVVTLK